MRWKWPPWKHEDPGPKLEEAEKRLEKVEADDVEVELLVERTRKVLKDSDRVLRENSFALTIRKALGAQQ